MNNKPTHSKASEVLDTIKVTIEVQANQKPKYLISTKSAAQQMYNDLIALVGEDSNPDGYDPDFINANNLEDIQLTAENRLKAELRAALRKYFGVEDE